MIVYNLVTIKYRNRQMYPLFVSINLLLASKHPLNIQQFLLRDSTLKT